MILGRTQTDTSANAVYVFTDCQSAINISAKQGKVFENIDVFREFWKCFKIFKERNIVLKLIWIHGHADILVNKLADTVAGNDPLI